MGTVCAKKKGIRVNQILQEPHQQENEQQVIVPQKDVYSLPTINVSSALKIPKKNKKIRDTVKAVTYKSAEGQKVLNDYIFDEFLGQGAFGKVKLAYKKDSDQKFAIKILKKSKLRRQREYVKDANGNLVIKDGLQDVKREIAIMKKVRHNNLIQLYEVIDNPKNDKLFMVLEFAPGGQLIEWDEDEQIFYKCSEDIEINEQLLKQLFRDCVKGLYFLHSNNIVHRDLKPQNVLIGNDNVAKIADFGVSQILGETDKLANTQGTYHFMAPETCDKQQCKEGYSAKAADIWALGVTFYAFAYLQIPFNGDTVADILNNIARKEVEFPSGRTPELVQFLQLLLTKDPQKRPTIQDIAHHPWLNAEHPLNVEMEMELGVSDQDIDCAISLSSIIRIKSWVSKWKSSSNFKKQQNQ